MNAASHSLLLLNLVLLMADVTIRATVLLALTAIIAILSHRASASFRHLVWALGLGCVLVLPLLSYSLPHWHMAVRTPVTHERQAAVEAPPALTSPSSSGSGVVLDKAASEVSPLSAPSAAALHVNNRSAQTYPPSTPFTPTQTSAGIPWTEWAVLVWGVGVLLALTRIGRGVACLRIVAASSTRASDASSAQMKAAKEVMRVSQPVTLLTASAAAQVTVPITWGILRPVVVIPNAAAAWSSDKLRAALLHELAHVRRRDWPLQTLAHLTCAFHWFNPLVWLAARRMRAESEAACDDLVLSVGLPASDYARHLLDVALGARDSRLIGSEAVAMAQTPRIEGRLRAVLATGLSRGTVHGRVAAGALIAALLLALPLAALRLTAQAQPVPEADRLQLGGNFTLRYAATVTDLETTQAQLREYQQLRADYDGLLKKNPYYQPVPAEYYAPFSYFQERRPLTRHLILTVSARNGHLLWRSQEGGHAFALVYNGKDGTQLFSDGQAGRIETGFQFAEMENCPLPAVGLPHVPLLKSATLVNSADGQQTWQVLYPVEGAEVKQGEVLYSSGLAHVTFDGGGWKVLDIDSSDEQFQFLQHQRFQGLWIASRMSYTKFSDEDMAAPSPIFSSMKDLMAYDDAHRTPTRVVQYRLLSASGTPLDMSKLRMRSATAPMPTPQSPSLDDGDVQEALHLRFYLQGWARSHETLLRRMGRATPSDFSWATAVGKSLPALPYRLWRGVDTLLDNAPPSSSPRDFVIARSRNSGAIPVYLWASGRITRVMAGVKGQNEIVPAFFGEDGTSSLAGDANSQPASDGSPGPREKPQLAGDTATTDIALGQKLQQNGQPRDGIPAFRRAVQIDPNNAEAQFWLANALYESRSKRFGTATRNTTVFIPAPPVVLDEAILHLQKAVALRPNDAQWHSALGTYLSNRGRDAEAVSEYRKALHLFPQASPPRVPLGEGEGSSADAEALCDAHRLMGDSLLKLKEYPSAVYQYQQSLRYRRTDDAFLGLGDALSAKGRRSEAKVAWKAVFTGSLHNPYYERLARERLADR